MIAAGNGQAHLFDAITGGLLRTLNNPDPAAGDGFGFHVAIDGNYVLIGAVSDDSVIANGGQAFLFDAATGNLLHSFRDPNPGGADIFGVEVAIDGNTVVIAANADDTNGVDAGQVFVFDAVTGNLRHTINSPSPNRVDRFGNSLSISGDRFLVGSLGDDSNGTDTGRAFLFDANTGALLRTVNDPTPADRDRFGSEVAIHGDRMLIATSPDNFSGSEGGQLFLFDVDTGSLLQTFDDPGTALYTGFGSEVAMSSDRILIGSPGNFQGETEPGQTYLYNYQVPEPASVVFLLIGFSTMVAGVRPQRQALLGQVKPMPKHTLRLRFQLARGWLSRWCPSSGAKQS